MSSNSLARWNGERADALNEIENAHVMIGGTERGRRYATQQVNYSYATLLSSHFQGFCRDLHTECLERIVAIVTPLQIQGFLRLEFLWNRSLDKGNPHPGGIGSDFNRLGLDFWAEVYALDTRNERRSELLQELNSWRNAIAHQDFDAVAGGGIATLHLATVKGWRSAANALARSFDQAMYNYLRALLGKRSLVMSKWRAAMLERKFKKGDLVQFRLGIRTVQGVVKEDRGPLGLKGRHLYLVEFGPLRHADSPSWIELPAADLQLVEDNVATK